MSPGYTGPAPVGRIANPPRNVIPPYHHNEHSSHDAGPDARGYGDRTRSALIALAWVIESDSVASTTRSIPGCDYLAERKGARLVSRRERDHGRDNDRKHPSRVDSAACNGRVAVGLYGH